MKLVKIVLLSLLLMHASSGTHDNFYNTNQKKTLLGAGLAGYGAYGWYTRNKLYNVGINLDLKKNIRRSLSTARLYSAGRGLGGLYLLSQYYNNSLQPAYYTPLKK